MPRQSRRVGGFSFLLNRAFGKESFWRDFRDGSRGNLKDSRNLVPN
jgi:hypothetical protein